jgi:hypothetical protein
VEPASGQTYAVQFDRPTPIGILVQVTTTNGNAANITQAILDYANGLIEITGTNGVQSNLSGFVVGASVSPFEIAGAILSENPGYYLSNVQIALETGGSYQSTPLSISINQIAYTQASYISVIIT